MEPLSNLLQQIFSPERFAPALKVLNQVTIPKLNNQIILLLRNIVRINNKATHQFDGLAIAVKVIVQSSKLEYTSAEWSSIGENFSGLIIAIFDSFLLYQNTSIIKDVKFSTLILEAGKSLLPIVDKVDCLRTSVNNNGYSSILLMICLDDMDFPVRKEIFLLFKPIIVKSDTRQRKNIMNTNEFFLSKMAAMVLNCGDFETQEAIVEVLMRFSYSSKQKLNKILFWFRDYPAVLTATKLLDYKSFDLSCRKFLNSVNRNINTNVVTLPCFEAYANEIKLQKPRSEEYEELWVDFSLKTGIIHIVCDSGANAWLRLFIDSKNVRNSFFSSRILKKNGREIKGKQILLELISPLEIVHHLREALIVTISLMFVESLDLDNIETNFFDRWYRHLNKAGKRNQIMDVKKAFQENIHHRCKQNEKFFTGASVSSVSSIHSCSTCSFRPCCHKKEKLQSSSSLRCRMQDFSTSTPKDSFKFQKEAYPHTNVATSGFGNFCPTSSKHMNLNSTPNINGGIFNHVTQQKFMEAAAKSSLVRGIFVGDDKKEDGLFKKMMEACSKKDKDKEIIDNSLNDFGKDLNGEKSVIPTKAQTQDVDGSNFDSKKVQQSSSKPLKLGISKNVRTLEDSGLKKVVDNADRINNIASSEESIFVMATHGTNKQNILNVNKGTSEMSDSSSSQVGTSDEPSTTTSRTEINLLNRKETKLKPQENIEQVIKAEKREFHGNIWNDTSPVTKKPVPHSPYLKLFDSKNSSFQSGQIEQDDLSMNLIKNISQNTESSNTGFKLKPPTLNLGSFINNESATGSQGSFSFSSKEKLNQFSSVNKNLSNESKIKLDKENYGFPEYDHKILNMSNISQNNKKENVTVIENTVKKRTTEIKTKPDDKVIVSSELDLKISHDKDKNETNFDDTSRLRKFNYLNDSNIIRKQTNEDKHQNIRKGDNSKDNSLLIENNQSNDVNISDSNRESLKRASKLSDVEKKANSLINIQHNDEGIDQKAEEHDTTMRKKALPKRGKRSTGTWDVISSGHNTTISSQPSIHCLSIPQKTYSTKPTVTRKPSSPEQTFEDLIKQKGKNNTGNEFTQKKGRRGRKRKLFTPNSSLDDNSPFKPGEDSVRPSEILFVDNPPAKTYKKKPNQNSITIDENKKKPKQNSITIDENKKKPKQNSITIDENKKKKRTSQSLEPLADIYNFRESSPSSVDNKNNGKITLRRKSLRTRAKKQYKEPSSEESDVFQKQTSPPKKKSLLKPKTSSAPVAFTLPHEKLSVSEKVSRFVLSMNESRERLDLVRQEDFESEMRLYEAPVEENRSDLSQLESVEPPVWLSSSEAGITSLLGSPDSFNAPTELIIRGDPSKSTDEEIEFIQSVIKSIECLSLSVKRKNPKIKSQEKIVKTVESFTSSGIEEINKKWEEAKQSLQVMMSNLDSMSESYKTFLSSLEKRMKDMIESSISDFNMDRSNSNSRSENLCKELKKMCHERHKLLKKQ